MLNARDSLCDFLKDMRQRALTGGDVAAPMAPMAVY